MATLNIKQFPDDLYARLREEAAKQHRSISQQVIYLLSEAVELRDQHSILELRGLGRDLWSGTRAAEHVASERDSWD